VKTVRDKVVTHSYWPVFPCENDSWEMMRSGQVSKNVEM